MESFVLASERKKPIEYKYAILLLATGSELILKSILEDVHPLFIKENLDSSTDITVRAENLVSRINKVYGPINSQKRILNLDEDNLDSIREIRNNIIHKEIVFDNEKIPQKIYANTLFSLDRIVKEFKGRTLSSEVTNWGYIVNIELIQDTYYNSVKGISFNGIAVPCPFCSIKKLVNKNNRIQCLHCGNEFNSIMEAINSLDDKDLVEQLFLSFSVEKYRKGMHFMDCPNCHEADYAWYDTEEQTVLCFSCGPVNTETCTKCQRDALITYYYESKSGIEDENYCFVCEGDPYAEVCPNCYKDIYKLKEKIKIDVKKPHRFYPNVQLEPKETVFIEVSLCPKCYELMESFEQKGIIEII